MSFNYLVYFLLSVLAVARAANGPEWTNYTTLTGFFLQDDPTTDPSTFDFTTTNFGLINRTYPTDSEDDQSLTQWQRFDGYVWSLNRASGRNVQYKVLYMGRHGQGYHNVAETYYGTPLWDASIRLMPKQNSFYAIANDLQCYWSKLDGNGTVVWADAHLTPAGVLQAEVAASFWASRIALQKIPTPQSYYTSPLSRCLATADITFSQLKLPSRHPFIPTVKELFREGISGHTCDRRSNRTYIHDSYPSYVIEPGFSEYDLLWKPDLGEVPTDEDIRSQTVLDQVFGSDSNTYISITSHSGEIASILRVLNHQPFSLNTGAVIPVLVKAETIHGPPTTTATLPWTALPTCTGTTLSVS